MAAMTIGSLAREAGVGVETVRYYQRRGLIAEPPRPVSAGSGGAVRRYGPQDARRLRFIRTAQAAGFTLDQIAELLALDPGDRPRARVLARTRLAELDRRIAELQAARAWLTELERECTSGEDGACPILAAFDEPGEAAGVRPGA